jgi:hypothetical protein
MGPKGFLSLMPDDHQGFMKCRNFAITLSATGIKLDKNGTPCHKFSIASVNRMEGGIGGDALHSSFVLPNVQLDTCKWVLILA